MKKEGLTSARTIGFLEFLVACGTQLYPNASPQEIRKRIKNMSATELLATFERLTTLAQIEARVCGKHLIIYDPSESCPDCLKELH